jgi:hypothetical protein
MCKSIVNSTKEGTRQTMLLDPTIGAAVTAGHPLAKPGMTETEWRAIVEVLASQIGALEEADDAAVRKLLAGQIVTLNIIFQELCKKAVSGNRGADKQMLSMALKCQRQASMTAQQLNK